MKTYMVDLIVLVIILFEFLMGLRRGLSGELFRLLGTGLVLAIGLGFYEDFGLMIANHSRLTQNHEMAVALAFLLIVVGMGICFLLLRIVFNLLVHVKFNDAFDRPAGGMAGIRQRPHPSVPNSCGNEHQAARKDRAAAPTRPERSRARISESHTRRSRIRNHKLD